MSSPNDERIKAAREAGREAALKRGPYPPLGRLPTDEETAEVYATASPAIRALMDKMEPIRKHALAAWGGGQPQSARPSISSASATTATPSSSTSTTQAGMEQIREMARGDPRADFENEQDAARQQASSSSPNSARRLEGGDGAAEGQGGH